MAEAEINSPFIFWCVRKIWGSCPSYEVSTEEEINNTPNNKSGVYIFYLDSGPTQYPIYVGVTSRNFRQRFKEHYKNGVINLYVSGEFPKNIPPIRLPLKAICLDTHYPMQSKLMESVFLAAFDFCLNEEENGKVRLTIDTGNQLRPEDSKPDFDITFDNVMKEIKNFYDEYKK